jgi:hypothetical protein
MEAAAKKHLFFVLFIKRLSIYICFLILAVLVVALSHSIICNGQMLADNVRASLSVLVQTQGAIIAIVITLTLVVVQITATTSSAQLAHYVIRKNPDVWLLLLSYIIAILYGLWVLGDLTLATGGGLDNQIVASESRNYIFLAYALGAFTLAILIPYTLRMTNFLRPDYLLKELSREISDEGALKPSESFLLFVDLLQVSAVHHNFSLVDSGFNQFTHRIKQFIDDEDSKKSKEELERICYYVMRLGQVSADAGNDTSILDIVRKMREIGEYSVTKKQTLATTYVIRTLFFVTKSAIEHKQYMSSQIGVNSIGLIGKLAEENDLFESANYAIEKLQELGPFAAHSQMVWATTQVGDELAGIGKVAVEKGQKDQTEIIIVSLNGCLNEAILRDLDDASRELIGIFEQLGVHSAEQKNDACTALMIVSLAEVSRELILKRRHLLVLRLIQAINEIGKKSENPVLPMTLALIAGITRCFVDYATSDDLSRIEGQILPLLDSIGKSGVNFDDIATSTPVLNEVGAALSYIGTVEIERGRYDLAYKVAESLFEIAQLANERKLSEITTIYVKGLSSLGRTAILEEVVSPLSLVSPSILNLKTCLIKPELEFMEKDVPIFVIDGIIKIATRSGELQQNDPVYRSIIELAGIGVSAAEKGYNTLVLNTICGLLIIGLTATDQKLESITTFVIGALDRIGKSAEENNQKPFVAKVCTALMIMGVSTKELGMDEPMDLATLVMAKFALIDETMMADVIQGYQKTEEITDVAAFQNFIEEYEKKLVKLKEGNSRR